ncbi:MAG TPA: ATP-dependent 6-phosphofructokinase, partial [Proteobacteria bacterium]|nr:ATP-dependent 6-phosphofructokinase [Pseudomonadota bacterium]
IGILTGGGDCPGINAVIRAVVKTAILKYDMKCIGIIDGYEGLIEGPRYVKLDYGSVTGLLFRGGTILGSSNRANPFAYKKEVDGRIVERDMSGVVLDNIRRLRLDALVVIGGDGTLTISHKLYQMGVPIVGVPKTIDNDLMATDVTFGFDTAVNTATEAIDRIQTTAESHHRVMIVETMGRYAGWIALKAGLAGGADVILIPEIPFVLEKVYEAIEWRRSMGRKYTIIVAAEGAYPKGGKMFVKKVVKTSHDQIRLGGVGDWLAKRIEQALNLETRVTVLGHIQRGGTPTAFDRVLATRFGSAAVHAVARREFGVMVCLKTPDVKTVPLEDAVGQIRRVDPGSDMLQAARDTGVFFGD